MKHAAILLTLAFQANAAWAQTPGNEYEERFIVTGALLRAAIVCGWQAQHIEDALSPVSAAELQSIARAYPKTTEQWMMNGANTFNSQVMQMGVKAACDLAVKVRREAVKTAK